MAPQPKRRHSGHRGRVRTLAKTLTKTALISCPSCKRLIHAHRVCPYCGFYKGKMIVNMKKGKQKSKNENQK